MAEERFVREFETKEEIKEADTDYLRKRGVKRLGHREVFTIKETEKGIELCGRTDTKYYFDDKEPEKLPMGGTCVLIPNELLPQVIGLFCSPKEYKVGDIKVGIKFERPGVHEVTIEAPGGRSITEEEGEKITKLIEEKNNI